MKPTEQISAETVISWKDPFSQAKGWLVINSIRRGAAGGNVTLQKNISLLEVHNRAKTMALLHTVADLPIGGAYGGIDIDPNHPQSNEVLQRWYRAMAPFLKTCVGIFEEEHTHVKSYINVQDVELWSSVEGILNGYYRYDEPEKINRIGQLQKGMTKLLKNIPLPDTQSTLYEMVKGYGIAETVKHFHDLYNLNIHDQQVAFYGLNSDSLHTAHRLITMGVSITGVFHKGSFFRNEKGFSVRQLHTLMESTNSYPETTLSAHRHTPVLIAFDPYDAITNEQWTVLHDGGLKVFVCGASHAEPTISNTDSLQNEYGQTILPYFVAGSGLFRLFTLLMDQRIPIQEKLILTDISRNIQTCLTTVFKREPLEKGFRDAAYEIAIKKTGTFVQSTREHTLHEELQYM